jgi:hypothetical protein
MIGNGNAFQDQNTLDEYHEAVEDGNLELAERIKAANPDLDFTAAE